MRTTETQLASHQQYAVEFVPDDALPPEQPWAMARCDEGTYLFVREGDVTPEVLEQAWGAFRWLALNRPHALPNVPPVVPDQPDAAAVSLREAVIRGHNATN